MLESAKEKGKSTGLVSTAEITDATPAAYASHVDSRDKKMKLRNSFIMIKLTANIK
ncbi:Alkaline phosphatase 4 precursor [Streptococcus pneumoniae]|nr:Alkaline phosphatase 4 precursor [Streptococcus pneumoniae]CRG03792.1 Alkaline phosphatase 4 precursor [Streptococcus pneumoniae]